MKRLCLLLVIGIASLASAAPVDYLVKIDLNSQGRIYDLADMQICVIDELDGYCLAVMPQAEFSLLKMQRFTYSILDADPREKSYYIVYPAPWVPLDNLKPYGDILFYDGNAVIFRMDEKNVIFLNQMQVELKKVFLRPMYLKREEQSYSPSPSNPFIDTLIQQMVNQVSPDTLLSFLNIVTKNFGNRYSTAPGCTLSIRWFYNKLRAYAIDSVYLHQWQAGYAKNCIGMKRGIRYPNWKRYVVICGHLDAVAVSPGADDNATGTLCALEAARIMRRYRFENGIRFIAFSGEEQGLLGSEAYCANAQAQGDTIPGAPDFDMVMYAPIGIPETLRLSIGRTRADTVLYNIFKAAVDTYTTQPTVRRSLSGGASDNSSFNNHGYASFCAIENRYNSNPHYHNSSDSVGASGYSIPFYASCARAAIAGMARLAVPMAAGIEEEFAGYNPAKPSIRVSPNPFRSRTRIAFNIGQNAKTTWLKIFDVGGREVKSFSVLSSLLSHPSPFVSWDGRDHSGKRLPAGVYIVRLKTDNEELKTKIVLLD